MSAVVLRTQPDERLVALSRADRTSAFEEIARRHGPALTAFAASVAPASQADDVVQEALIKAHAALLDGAEPEVLTAWLFRIVRNTALDARRGTRTHEQLDENYDGVEQPPQALERRAEIAALVAALNDLPRAQREAIVQREFEGRGHEEIALALGQSPGAVRQLIHRARNSLRESIGGLVPPALVRLATMPGATEVAGGGGLAAVVKLGLAAIVATGTIVAGASINKGPSPSSAQARAIPRGGESVARGGGGDSPAHGGSGRIGVRGSKARPSPSQGTSDPGQPTATDTPPGGSGQGGGAGQGGDPGSGSGSGSGSDLGSGDHNSGSADGSGSDSSPSSEPGSTGGSTEPGDSGGSGETTTGGDGTSTPPPSDPPSGGGGDGTRI